MTDFQESPRVQELIADALDDAEASQADLLDAIGCLTKRIDVLEDVLRDVLIRVEHLSNYGEAT